MSHAFYTQTMDSVTATRRFMVTCVSAAPVWRTWLHAGTKNTKKNEYLLRVPIIKHVNCTPKLVAWLWIMCYGLLCSLFNVGKNSHTQNMQTDEIWPFEALKVTAAETSHKVQTESQTLSVWIYIFRIRIFMIIVTMKHHLSKYQLQFSHVNKNTTLRPYFSH